PATGLLTTGQLAPGQLVSGRVPIRYAVRRAGCTVPARPATGLRRRGRLGVGGRHTVYGLVVRRRERGFGGGWAPLPQGGAGAAGHAALGAEDRLAVEHAHRLAVEGDLAEVEDVRDLGGDGLDGRGGLGLVLDVLDAGEGQAGRLGTHG